MPVTPPITNLATGKPVKVALPLRLNRDASRKGIQFSSVETFRDFTNVKSQRSNPSMDEIGQRAGQVQRKFQSGTQVDITI